MIDVVGVVLCLEQLEVEQVFSSPLPINLGAISTKHGLLPATSPATSALLTQSNVPVFQPKISSDLMSNVGEIVTPTGAAILTTLATFEQPLIKVNGNTIIEHIIKNLSRFGIEEVLLLCGYKHVLFKKKYQGVTEFLSKKTGKTSNEVMAYKDWELRYIQFR